MLTKRYYLHTAILLVCALHTHAQRRHAPYYDSTQNTIDGTQKEMQALVGQELYVLPRSEKYTGDIKETFYTNTQPASGITAAALYKASKARIYLPVPTGCKNDDVAAPGDQQGLTAEEYKQMKQQCEFVTDYSAISSKKFRITGIENGYYKLQNEDNGDVCYHDALTPALMIVGFFEKLKATYINADLIYTGENVIIDMHTGNEVENALRSEWKCTTVTLADISGNPFPQITLIMRNAAGYEVSVTYSELFKQFALKQDYIKHK